MIKSFNYLFILLSKSVVPPITHITYPYHSFIFPACQNNYIAITLLKYKVKIVVSMSLAVTHLASSLVSWRILGVDPKGVQI